MGSPYRVNRIQELLRRELSDIVQRLEDPRLRLVTVVDAEISRDLSTAKVFVSALGGPEEQRAAVTALRHALGFIRREVARRIQLRQVPELEVIYDGTSERAARVGALLNSLKTAGADE